MNASFMRETKPFSSLRTVPCSEPRQPNKFYEDSKNLRVAGTKPRHGADERPDLRPVCGCMGWSELGREGTGEDERGGKAGQQCRQIVRVNYATAESGSMAG